MRVKRAGSWSASFRVARMDKVVDIAVKKISGTIATIEVEYVWSWQSRRSRKGLDNAVVTLEKIGASLRIG